LKQLLRVYLEKEAQHTRLIGELREVVAEQKARLLGKSLHTHCDACSPILTLRLRAALSSQQATLAAELEEAKGIVQRSSAAVARAEDVLRREAELQRRSNDAEQRLAQSEAARASLEQVRSHACAPVERQLRSDTVPTCAHSLARMWRRWRHPRRSSRRSCDLKAKRRKRSWPESRQDWQR
jgi:hypothetical protein